MEAIESTLKLVISVVHLYTFIHSNLDSLLKVSIIFSRLILDVIVKNKVEIYKVIYPQSISIHARNKSFEQGNGVGSVYRGLFMPQLYRKRPGFYRG